MIPLRFVAEVDVCGLTCAVVDDIERVILGREVVLHPGDDLARGGTA